VLRKISLILSLCLLLSVSLILPDFVAASPIPVSIPPSSNGTSGQVPAPTVSFVNGSSGSGANLINLAVNVQQGNVCGSVWSVHKSIMPTLNNDVPPTFYQHEGFQGEIGTTVGNDTSGFEINLGSETTPTGTNSSLNLPGMFINTPYGSIPISFCDASSVDVQVGNVTYVNGLPTVTNTITFNDIALPTYGQGSSTVTFVISQNIIANWTNMIIKIGVYADLSNMKLYLPDGTEIPPNTDFSFNLMYTIDMSAPAASALTGQVVNLPPSDITATSVFFAINDTAGTQISIANMNLGDTYTDIQGSNQFADKTPTVYFTPSGVPSWSVNCFQGFPNLTYGVTTAVESDPTITVQHNAVTAELGSNNNLIMSNFILYAAIVGGVASVAVVGTVIFVRRRKR